MPYAQLESPQTLNLYAYVMNNPVSKVDPTGHVCETGECDVSHGEGNLDQIEGQDGQQEDSDRNKGFIFKVNVHDKKNNDDPPKKDINELWYYFVLGIRGHHGMPGQWYKLLPKGSAARTAFERWATGELTAKHYFDAAHRMYNQAIARITRMGTAEGREEVLKEGINGAREEMQKVLDSENPAVRGFLDNMETPSGSTGREALQGALNGDSEAAGDFVSGAVGEVIKDAAEDGLE